MSGSVASFQLQRIVRRFRLVGWIFLVTGTIVCVAAFNFAFNSADKITINGVPTYDFHAKLKAAEFTCLGPIIGVVLAFTPKGWIESFFGLFLGEVLDLLSKLSRFANFDRNKR